MIVREEMLELTRRMNLKRNCFLRIAGAYMAEDGIIDGTFNTNFRKLADAEKQDKIAVAKEIPFAETNVELVEYRIPDEKQRPGSIWQMLFSLTQCELKNDALLDVFYEMAGEKYRTDQPYCILFFYGAYDMIRKAEDKTRWGDSEETYRFLIGTFCPLYENDEPGLPECGFLFPAFRDHGADLNRIHVFRYEGTAHEEILDILDLR